VEQVNKPPLLAVGQVKQTTLLAVLLGVQPGKWTAPPLGK